MIKQFFKILFFLAILTNNLHAETGYEMWLRYQPIQNKMLKNEYSTYCKTIFVPGESEICSSIKKELAVGIEGMLGIKPNFSNVESNGILIKLVEELPLNEGGYSIKSTKDQIVISGNSDAGLLYGTFHLLRMMQMNLPVSNLDTIEKPEIKLRLLNHWDNPGKIPEGRYSVERGYAGESIFKWDELPKTNQRYTDYARYLASVGINGTVINNVNTAKKGLEGWKLLTPEYLPKIKTLADVFRKHGIQLYISVNFFSPVKISGLTDADPMNPEVQQWWKHKVQEIYSEIPDFGGFLVKADSEGEPGPIKYGRTHADGANLLANALNPYGGVVFWRAFVYSGEGELNPDRACQSYEMFKSLDGKFAENAIVQIKNGPIDFQVREPVSPLFGAMPRTGQMMEFQITQEYTGHSRHVCFFVPQWKEIFDFDTFSKGECSEVSKVINGSLYAYKYSGVAGVSNFGDDENWTGHIFAQANSYGFGRLSWNPNLTAEEIANEWILLTFGNNKKVNSIVRNILLTSWETYENYTSPLGVGLMCSGSLGDEGHFYPAPASRTKYHKADKHGVGYDRSELSGSGFTFQYNQPNRAAYENPDTCPDELLLFMHHVPYTHKLKSGKTVIQHIYDSHNQGVAAVANYISEWEKLNGLIDDERYGHVYKKLNGQLGFAEEWRDSINQYFYQLSGIKDKNK
jgi:alpha-glucuronidase